MIFKRLTSLFILFFTFSAFAFNPQTFRFSQSFETLLIEDAAHKKYNLLNEDEHPWFIGLSYNYVENPLILIDSSRTRFLGRVISDYQSFDINYTRHIDLKSGKAVQLQIRSSFSQLKINDDSLSSLGDVYLGAKIRVYGDEKSAFALTPFVDIPTGNEEKFTSDGSIGLGILGSYGYHQNRWHFFANLGYRYAQKAKYANIDLANRIITGLGGHFDFNKSWALNIEWKGEFGTSFSKDQNPSDLLGGLRYKITPTFNTFFGGGVGGTKFEGDSNTDSNDYRLYAGLKWSPQYEKERKVKVKTRTVYKTKYITTKQKEHLRERLLLLKGVKFHTAKDTLTRKSKSILNYVAETIIEYQRGIESIVVEGHTDSVGNANYNRSLSQKRAASVVRYLRGKRVRSSLLRPIGYGETRLKVRERSERDKETNRRVEFKVRFKEKHNF